MVIVGRVSAPHGIKGWIKVQPFTQEIDGLLAYSEWWFARDGEWRQFRVAESSVHGGVVLARLEGCTDREAAAALKGGEVAVPRRLLPANREGEYYWSDLLGMEVLNRRGERLGRVAKVLETGANNVLVLEGEKERLLPFVDSVILNVDVAGGRLSVDWEIDY
ncbi:MAG TPA: ribosome maturation factor RimM [Burkholderiales bacterium]|jgi:16S rRNA processing protein RimM|nr:ribosome maturation factor RimM [Burkholderiales bacterium]